MPVIALKKVEECRPDIQETLKMYQDWVGDTVFGQVMAHCPDMFVKFNEFYGSMLAGSVESEIKELSRLRLARLNDCHY